MSGFIATSHQPPSGKIVNNGFFPDIEMANFAQVMQIRQQVTPERIEQALRLAMIDVNRRLKKIKENQNSFDAVFTETIGGVSIELLLYNEAVYTRAKAFLLEEFRNYDLTLEGHGQADQAEDSVDDNLCRCTDAIRKLLGYETAMQVELI